MEAKEIKLTDFLLKPSQLAIPIYQRTYSWKEDQCRQLWDDIIRIGMDDKISEHFIGSIIYIKTGNQVVLRGGLRKHLIIDGQQRLTSVTLLIAALAEALGEDELEHGISAKELRSNYLINSNKKGEDRFRLLLSQTDKKSLIAIIEGNDPPNISSIRVTKNFAFFKDLIRGYEDGLKVIWAGLVKLGIVHIGLSPKKDDPQRIFESMNSTGLALSQGDLIRNFILMNLELEDQNRLYKLYWRPMEKTFGQENYTTHFDTFIRHYLTIKKRQTITKSEVYKVFKAYARTSKMTIPHVESILKDILYYSQCFCKIALEVESDAGLKLAFQNLRGLKSDVTYPFLLTLYHSYEHTKALDKKEFVEAICLIETYVFRRRICGGSDKSLNKIFATFNKALDDKNYLESIKAHFLTLHSTYCFPDDTEFEKNIRIYDLYNKPNIKSYWLLRFENFERKEPISLGEYTIEHIMPQNENVPKVWQKELGTNWQSVHGKYLHTLGNLTLTGYNPEFGDKSFAHKRDIKGGFKDSTLNVNKGLGTFDIWNEEAIKKRAACLAKRALEIWPMPKLSEEILEKYREDTRKYSLKDHPHLLHELTNNLFKAFREEVRDLNPDVYEEILKHYIAYKLETNFVDVSPQKKGLSIILNMDFDQINDPKGICKDVSNKGRSGNGEVSFHMRSLDELPYAIELVRQSLELQLDDEDDI